MPRRLETLVLALTLAAAPAAAMVEDCRRLSLVEADSGKPIVGVEDLRITADGRTAYLAAYDRRSSPPAEGAIYVLELARLSPAPDRLDLAALRPEPAPAGGFRPHGLALADGERLVVVNRRILADGERQATLDELEVDGARLRPLRSVAPAGLCNPNAVLVENGGAWLVSDDRDACDPFQRRLDTWLGRATGRLLHIEDDRVTTLLDELHFANGVAKVQGVVWVAETRGHRLRSSDGRALALPLAPDNLTVDAAGRLWVAGPTHLLAYAAFTAGLPGFTRAGSRVAMVADGQVELVLDDGGALISGATVAAAGDGYLLVGAAFDRAIAYCRLAD